MKTCHIIKCCCFSFAVKFGNMVEKPLGWGYQIIPLNDDVSKLSVTPEGSLLFDIQITLYSAKRIELAIHHIHRFKQIFTQKHQYDMGEMFQLQRNSIFPIADSPTKIISSDGVEFPVNRGIICARSEVFRTMFQQSQMTEVQKGEVRVKDIPAKTMKVLLHFLYTGQLLQDEWYKTDTLVELLYAAGKYQLEDLLSFLDQVVGLLCNERNMVKLINLARKLNLKKAEEDLFNFIKGHVKTYDEMKALVENPAMDFDDESAPDNQQHSV